MTHLNSHTRLTQLRRVADNMDHVRIPLNAEERSTRQGEIPYWGANSVVDYVDHPLIAGELVLIGEDGAPFLDPLSPVAFATNEPIWPNNHIHVLRPRRNVDHRYLAYALNSVDYSRYIKGSTRDKLNQSELSSIQLLIPSLDSQHYTADFLDRETAEIDALVADFHQATALTEEALRSSMHSIFSNSVEPFSNARLKMLATLKSGSGFPNSEQGATDFELPFFKVGNLKEAVGGYLNRAPNTISRPTARALGASILKPGTIIMAKIGAAMRLNRNAIVSQPSCIDNNLLSIATSDDIAPEYLAHYLAGLDLSPFILPGAVPSLDITAFGNTSIPLPHRNRQMEIAESIRGALDDSTQAIHELDLAITLAKERRAALITAAVTGQIDVTAKRRPAAEQLEDDIKELS